MLPVLIKLLSLRLSNWLSFLLESGVELSCFGMTELRFLLEDDVSRLPLEVVLSRRLLIDADNLRP